MTIYCLNQRDGPFDIHGGGGGIYPRDKLFFLSFCTTSNFFKNKLQQVFLFFFTYNIKNKKNVNKSNTLNEKTLNFYLIISCQ